MSRTWKGVVVTAVTVFCLHATVHAQIPLRPAHEVIAEIEGLGGRIYRTPEGQADIVDMRGKQVTDAHLSMLQSLPTMRILNIDASSVTADGLEVLLKLPNLEGVSLRRTQVSPAAATALKKRHPKVYRVDVDSPGGHVELLVLLVILMPMGLLGAWLIRASQKKRTILSSPLYARAMVMGFLLLIASVVLNSDCSRTVAGSRRSSGKPVRLTGLHVWKMTHNLSQIRPG